MTAVTGRYDPVGRWPRYDAIRSTGWEPLGTVVVDAATHAEFLASFTDRAPTEDRVHPAVVASVVLGLLRNAFPLPEPDGVPLIQMHTSEEQTMFGGVAIGEPSTLLGRLVADLERRSFQYEGWLTGADGAPRARSAFTIRMLDLAAVTTR
jgi:hypothetical protein